MTVEKILAAADQVTVAAQLAERQRKALNEIRELHRSSENDDSRWRYCTECGIDSIPPCPTVAILERHGFRMTAATELTLFDDDIEATEPVGPSIVYDLPNRRQGHLRIDGERGTICAVNLGSVVTLGPIAGPTVDLTADQCRIVGEYFLRMAERLSTTEEAGQE